MRNVYKVRKLIRFSRRLLVKQRRDNKVAWVGYTTQGNCVVFILFEIYNREKITYITRANETE